MRTNSLSKKFRIVFCVILFLLPKFIIEKLSRIEKIEKKKMASENNPFPGSRVLV